MNIDSSSIEAVRGWAKSFDHHRPSNIVTALRPGNPGGTMNNRMIVIGTGTIGGIIGGRLARAGHDMTFVDVDREHVAATRENGLQVDVPDGPCNVRINIVY